MIVSTSRSLRARCLASSQHLPSGESRVGAGHGGYARVMYERTPPCQVPRTWSSRAPPRRDLGEDRYGGLFVHRGGFLSIATQEPNWSLSPPPLGLVLVIRTTQRRLRHAWVRALPTQNAKAYFRIPFPVVVCTSRGTPEHPDSGAQLVT